MPTMRQLVTSGPGGRMPTGWSRQGYQMPMGYGPTTPGPTASVVTPNAVSSPFMYNWNDPQAQPQLKPMQPYQSLVDPNDAWAKATEYRVNLMQQNPEYFNYGQARPQGSKQVYDAKQSNAKFFRDMAAANGGSWQSSQQDYIRRADMAKADRYSTEAQSQRNAPGGPAQWGWDGGRGTYQPLNHSAMNASFGPRAAPSAAFQAAQAATQRAYDIPTQQSARTRQFIYGYGG